MRRRTIPTALQKTIGKPLDLTGDWVIAGDWHIPYHDTALAAIMCQIARNRKIKQLLISGDLLNEDTFSKFDNITEIRFEDECKIAEEVIKGLRKFFKRIVWLIGNHDYRILRLLEDGLDVNRLARLIDSTGTLEVSRYPYCTINGKWHITHPNKFRKTPGSLARELATKHHKHVLVAHGHLMSLSFDISGEYYSLDGGAMVDTNQVEYIQLNDNTYAKWQTGFVILKDNRPELVPRREVLS